MIIVDIVEAKDNLSKLLESIENGIETEIIIERNGRSVARLLPMPSVRRRLGAADGKYPHMSLEQFNADDDEIRRMFEDGPIFPDDDKPTSGRR